ncbi:MAG: phosphoglycolate phosphatase [Halovenus sp.]
MPTDAPPLAVDIDGTLTDEHRSVDPRTFPVLRAWPSPVVVATGKAMPYPVALCEFLGIEPVVIAENGGVALVGQAGTLEFQGNPETVAAAGDAYRERGHSFGWGPVDIVNRWRETELAVSREMPLAPLEEVAADHGLVVVDTGFAYHLKSPDFDKGTGLVTVCDAMDIDPSSVVAVGDSDNDVPAFEVAGTSIAVANAAEAAQERADHVTDTSYAAGFLEAIEWLCRP